ncbi:hypothetical protein QQP08_015448 [Theobroma cacao]|nr:hypothetical protein QQP08_015448 [Theobroma cacao]
MSLDKRRHKRQRQKQKIQVFFFESDPHQLPLLCLNVSLFGRPVDGSTTIGYLDSYINFHVITHCHYHSNS